MNLFDEKDEDFFEENAKEVKREFKIIGTTVVSTIVLSMGISGVVSSCASKEEKPVNPAPIKVLTSANEMAAEQKSGRKIVSMNQKQYDSLMRWMAAQKQNVK